MSLGICSHRLPQIFTPKLVTIFRFDRQFGSQTPSQTFGLLNQLDTSTLIRRVPDTDVQSHFSSAARSYDQYANVQSKVATRLVNWWRSASPHAFDHCPVSLLEVGCGTGNLTTLLCEHFSEAEITACDLSSEMIQVTKEKLNTESRTSVGSLAFLPSDMCDIQHRYPCIVSSSALHWVQPIEVAIQTSDRLLEDDGEVAFAVMVDGTLRELHESRLAVAPDKPPLSSMPTEDDLRAAVARVGWIDATWRAESFTVHFPTMDELFGSIRRQGVTGGKLSRAKTALTPAQVRALSQEYESRFRDPVQGIAMTYQVVYLNARKPDASVDVAAQ